MICPTQEISESIRIDIRKVDRMGKCLCESALEYIVEIRGPIAKQLDMSIKRSLIRTNINPNNACGKDSVNVRSGLWL